MNDTMLASANLSMAAAARRASSARRGSIPTWRLAALLLLAALLSGCANTLASRVTTFHVPDSRFEGRRFALVASPDQAGSLEYRAYADLVRKALVARGLVDVTAVGEASSGIAGSAPADAELTVQMHYRIDDGRAVSVATPNYGYMQAGPVWSMTPYVGPGGRIQYAWAPTWPMSYGMIGQTVSQAIVYRRELRVEIDDARKRPAATPAPVAPAAPEGRLYEGVAFSEGQSATLAVVMPAMVKALFTDFPGPNGATRIIEVPFEQ